MDRYRNLEPGDDGGSLCVFSDCARARGSGFCALASDRVGLRLRNFLQVSFRLADGEGSNV